MSWYDRVTFEGRRARVHQEDLCQVLGRYPTRKYENEGGPGSREIARAIRSHCTRPGEDLRTFARAIALNWIVGGTDAHAKNFSLLIGEGGRASLAPLYDLASALPYPGRYPPRLKLAMKVGGESRLGHIRVRHWERFAAQAGLPADEVLGICESLAAEIPERFAEIVTTAGCGGTSHPIVARLEQAIALQAKACLASLQG